MQLEEENSSVYIYTILRNYYLPNARLGLRQRLVLLVPDLPFDLLLAAFAHFVNVQLIDALHLGSFVVQIVLEGECVFVLLGTLLGETGTAGGTHLVVGGGGELDYCLEVISY